MATKLLSNDPHARSARRSAKAIRDRLKAQGICWGCKKSPVAGTGYNRCLECRVKQRKLQKAWRSTPGHCIQCGANSPEGMSRCANCRSGQRRRDRARTADLAARNMCVKCGQLPCLPAFNDKRPTTKTCETCYLKKRARQALGHQSCWTVLRDKLESQGRRCAYTGEHLTLGLNDGLDHRLPVARHPERRHDPENVEWVTREINQFKWNRTPEEFVALLNRIIAAVGARAKSEAAGLNPAAS